jgi:hypothetical protein
VLAARDTSRRDWPDRAINPAIRVQDDSKTVQRGL